MTTKIVAVLDIRHSTQPRPEFDGQIWTFGSALVLQERNEVVVDVCIGSGIRETPSIKVAVLSSGVLDHVDPGMAPVCANFAQQVSNRGIGAFDELDEVQLGIHERTCYPDGTVPASRLLDKVNDHRAI